jgi:hypothetical protein
VAQLRLFFGNRLTTANWTLAVDAASFDIDGQAVTLTWTQNWTLAVTAATFQIDGKLVAFGLTCGVDTSAFSPSSQDITLLWQQSGAWVLAVDRAEFSIVGNDVGLSLSAISTEQNAGGWPLVAMMREQRSRQLEKELEEEQERIELADRLEKILVQEGSLTQAQADLIRLRGLVAQYRLEDLPNKARRALAFAERAKSELSLRLAMRELRKVQEEEEYAILLLMALD